MKIKLNGNAKKALLGSAIAALAIVFYQNFAGVYVMPSPADYSMVKATSPDVLWPAANVIDRSPFSAYSSHGFSSDVNSRNTYLDTFMSKPMAISRVILQARLHNNLPQGFPQIYEVLVLDPSNNTQWISVGTFGTQPDSTGVAVVDLGDVYVTSVIRIKPLKLGKDVFNNHYFQMAEVRAIGPVIYNFVTATATEAISGWPATYIADGSDSSVYSSNVFSSPENNRNVSLTANLSNFQVVAKLMLTARMHQGKSMGFPERYQVEITSPTDINTWVNLGVYTAQPNDRGVAVIDLGGARRTAGVRITPRTLGNDSMYPDNFYFQLGELNFVGPMIYPSTTSTASEETMPSSAVRDLNPNTYFSSRPFTTVENSRGSSIAVWMNSSNPVSKVLLTARMVNGVAVGFPKKYVIHVGAPDNSKWMVVGAFQRQPNSEGRVLVNLPTTYLTHGIVITPVELGSDGQGGFAFQLAEVQMAGPTVRSDRIGAEVRFATLSLKPGEYVSNGKYKLTLKSDGNLAVQLRQLDGTTRELWRTKLPARTCGTNCLAQFGSDGVLRLTQNGTTYWSTVSSARGNSIQLSKRFPYVNVMSNDDAVWPFLRPGQALSYAHNLDFEFTTAGNIEARFKNTSGAILSYWNAGVPAQSCGSSCFAIIQPDSKIALYNNGKLYWLVAGPQ